MLHFAAFLLAPVNFLIMFVLGGLGQLIGLVGSKNHSQVTSGLMLFGTGGIVFGAIFFPALTVVVVPIFWCAYIIYLYLYHIKHKTNS